MGKGGYHGASTIVISGSRKWQSEDFYALPLEPRWKALLQRHAQADAGRQGKMMNRPLRATSHVFMPRPSPACLCG